MSHSFSKPHYRNDLQILRAVAVIFVMLFHLKLDFLRGGYVGVDVFFVLSGYFIAQAFSKIDNWNDAKAFYNRRIRRILPLAWLVFLFLMIIGPLLFLPPELQTLLKDFLAALTLGPNIGYWRDDSYFENALFRPMLHYWSLGVEYQYYLVFPLALYIMQRWKFMTGAFFVGSLALCVAVSELSAKTAFFWMPMRFWEFLLGYQAFRMQQRGVEFAPALRAALLGSGAVLLGASAYFFTIKTVFPGYAAIIPVMGTFLFILGKMPPWPRFLAWPEKMLIGIGTISFSLYLWHYPVIFILTYMPFIYGGVPTVMQNIIAIAVTFSLSITSYIFIEEKFRDVRAMPNKIFYGWMIGLLTLSILTAAAYPLFDYNKNAYTEHQQNIFFALKDHLGFRCGSLFSVLNPQAEFCELATGAGKQVMLTGDSHADAIKSPFLDFAKKHNASLFFAVKNCRPGFENCPVDMFVEEAKRKNITDFVFHGVILDSVELGALDQMVAKLRAEKITVHIIDPTPIFKKTVPSALYLCEDIVIPVEEYRNANAAYFQWKHKRDDVHFYATEPLLCAKGCVAENKDGVLYFDERHLTITGANVLKPIVEKIYD